MWAGQRNVKRDALLSRRHWSSRPHDPPCGSRSGRVPSARSRGHLTLASAGQREASRQRRPRRPWLARGERVADVGANDRIRTARSSVVRDLRRRSRRVSRGRERASAEQRPGSVSWSSARASLPRDVQGVSRRRGRRAVCARRLRVGRRIRTRRAGRGGGHEQRRARGPSVTSGLPYTHFPGTAPGPGARMLPEPSDGSGAKVHPRRVLRLPFARARRRVGRAEDPPPARTALPAAPQRKAERLIRTMLAVWAYGAITPPSTPARSGAPPLSLSGLTARTTDDPAAHSATGPRSIGYAS